MNKFKGTGVALVTPFRKEGEVDFNALQKLVEFQIENGVNYLVVQGTTGESIKGISFYFVCFKSFT